MTEVPTRCARFLFTVLAFQSTIPANGKAETYIDVACNPEERYEFRVKLWP